MKFISLRKFAALCGIALVASLLFVAADRAALPQQADAQKPAAETNPKEQKDYKELYTTKDDDKKIQLGITFLQKYPNSMYVESVYNHLVHSYYAKQDWPDLYTTADKAIAMDPDDADVLAIEGLVISRLNRADDPDAQKKLEKSERMEKYVLELVPNMAKPARDTVDDFAKAKTDELAEAHSALGVDYFRAQDFENAAKELQLATQGTSAPDQTDFYVLGIVEVQLKRFSDAVDAFQKCSQLPGGLSDRCKQQMNDAKKQVK